jgi:hypothetical protein
MFEFTRGYFPGIYRAHKTCLGKPAPLDAAEKRCNKNHGMTVEILLIQTWINMLMKRCDHAIQLSMCLLFNWDKLEQFG